MNTSTNYVYDVLDEIALEGLDGITLDALWKRLSVRPNFCFKIDENSKVFIWNICLKLRDVKFYELPEKRKTLESYDNSSTSKEQDLNIELDSIYPYSNVKTENGIFGSCQHYWTRKDVTDTVAGMSLQMVEESYPGTLVIVASQESRSFALLGQLCPPNLDFSKSTVHYDVLERIGRCRSTGIPTHGKGSLQSIVEDSKSIFYYLKILLKYKIVKKQSLFGSLQTNPNGSKVYLTRFCNEYMNDYQMILQTAIEELKCRPNYRMSYDEFYQLFDPDKRSRVKKYSKSAAFRKYIMVSKILPYREFFPNATQAEWERKSKLGERVVRCFQLLDPNTEVADIFDKECDSDEEDLNAPSDFLMKETYYRGMPLLHQTYFHIKNSGPHGMSIRELAEATGLTRSFIRYIVRRLIHDKLCKCFEEISGRRHSKRYMVGDNVQNIAAASEIVQILSESKMVQSKEPGDVPLDGDSGEVNDRTDPNPSVEPSADAEKKIEYKSIEEENVPYRTLRRIGMIIRAIKAHHYRLFIQIYKCIRDEEIKEGLTTKVCRTSVFRILRKLDKDGLIQIIELKSKDDESAPPVKIYAEPNFVLDEKLAEAIVHSQTTYKTVDPSKILDEEDVQVERQLCDALLQNLTQMKRMLPDGKAHSEKAVPKDAKERELTCSPKFIRLNIIHDLMFYLVYEYTGIPDKPQEELILELSKTCDIDDDLKKEMPPIYSTQLTNYLFVPPLLKREGIIDGWFLESDILIRMPLSVYVKILRVQDTTPELLSYLNHPVRKHFLVKDLPANVRQTLFRKPQYHVAFSCDVKRLSFLGLIQFGARCGKEQYQTLLYLNRRATLFDTRTSPPSYLHVSSDIQFPVRNYTFNTKMDVKNYWQEMCDICLGTNLGAKANMIGKEVLAVRELSKESLRKFAEPKTASKAVADDDGTLPGDHLGAGGIDSAMFSFLRSNWIGPVLKSNDGAKQSPLNKVPLIRLKKDLAKKKQRILLQKSRLKKPFKIMELYQRPATSEGRPSSVRTRKVKERELRFKRIKKTYYDEVDIEALKLKNALRVTWSPAEDHLLLICNVAMLYLCPNPRVFFRIPWSEVRCNLQKNLVESRDKTQKAIARRVKYMMRNPTTKRSVTLCLEELNQIPDVKERFDCTKLMNAIKPSAPNLTELQDELYEKFHSLIDFMKERFKRGSDFSVEHAEEDLLPDTQDDFMNTYQLETETCKEEMSLKKIRESVLRAILMSSLSCRADKTSSAVQLFDIYRQYEDDELQNAIKRLHRDKVIALKKNNNSASKAGQYIPLSHSPCKLSFSFQILLNMKYSQSLYPDSFSILNKLTQFAGDAEGFHVDLNECNVPLYILACIDLVSLRSTVPEQVIVLDSHTTMDNEAYEKMLKRYCEMLQLSNCDSKFVCTSGQLLTPMTKPSTIGGNGNKRPADDADGGGGDCKKPKLSPGGAGAADETKRTENDEEDEVSRSDESEGPWRVALYMMREEAKKEINNFAGGNHAQEFFVVNASKVHCTVSQRLAPYLKKLDPKFMNNLVRDIVSRHFVPLSLVSEEAVIGEFRGGDSTDGDKDTIKRVLEFIYAKRELGVTNKELKANFDASALSDVIRHLLDSKIVIKAGIQETNYVGQKYFTPWLLNSFKITRLEREKIKPSELSAIEVADNGSEDRAEEDSSAKQKKKRKGVITVEDLKSSDYNPPSCSMDAENKVKVIIRPWIRIDGSLNRKVLDRFLGTVLGYVMANPGATIRSVMNKFSPSFIPVWTKDLIEILHGIGCISFTTYITKTKSTLFTEEEIVCFDGCSGLDDDENVVVEAKVDAITILGLFIGKRSYSKDFLTE